MRFLSALFSCLFLVAVMALPAYAQLAVPNAAGMTYGHVHLNVSDIELHKWIWVDHFGGVVVQKGALTAVRLPNLLVALTAREPTMETRDTLMDHFGFKVRNIADPAGTFIELTQGYDEF